MKSKSKMLMLMAGVSAAAVTAPTLVSTAAAQEARSQGDTIVVTARRREETLQDVPAVVNPVTRAQLDKYNIRDATDITTLVPGLSLGNNANGIGGSASLRGVNFDINASGFNATVEFYLNDSPMTAQAVLQSIFDVEQIEVLRGPQGTLRGRASPSGAITVRTKRPDTLQAGGYLNATANDIGGWNLNGAVNFPIIEDVLAVRVAGLTDENEGNRVRTVNTSLTDAKPKSETEAARLSVLFTPTDNFSLYGTYQTLDRSDVSYDQYESASEFNSGAPASPVTISAGDRLSILETPRMNEFTYDIYNVQAEYDFAGQSLIYIYNRFEQEISSVDPSDDGNFFQGFDHFQRTDPANAEVDTHEIRIQNEERLFDRFDYVIGYLSQETSAPTDLVTQTPVALPAFAGGSVVQVVETPIQRRGGTEESSIFGSVTFHATDRWEITGGLRMIDYKSDSMLFVGGNLLVDDPVDEDTTIYQASTTYEFTPNVTGYAAFGTSWRAGASAIGDFSLNQSALERSFLATSSEESESYELGIKSKLFDNKLSLNVSAYHQEFEDYPYRAPGQGVFFANFAFGGFDPMTGAPIINPEVDSFNFIAGVPVEVDGVEADVFWFPNSNFTFGSTISYSKGEITDGFIPCNDFDQDGQPDDNPPAPDLVTLLGIVGADNLSGCTVTQPAGFGAEWQATLQGEYNRDLTPNMNGFVRGLLTYNGDSDNDPTNAIDDVDAYSIFNLYAGLRGGDANNWELSLYAKNLFDEEVVLTRNASPAFTAYQELQPPTFMSAQAQTFESTYHEITTNAPQEFGVNFRYYFGSR